MLFTILNSKQLSDAMDVLSDDEKPAHPSGHAEQGVAAQPDQTMNDTDQRPDPDACWKRCSAPKPAAAEAA